MESAIRLKVLGALTTNGGMELESGMVDEMSAVIKEHHPEILLPRIFWESAIRSKVLGALTTNGGMELESGMVDEMSAVIKEHHPEILLPRIFWD